METTHRRAVVETAVRELLESSRAFPELPVERRKEIADSTIVVAEAVVGEELVRPVDFPAFVAGLIEGTFGAIVDASIQQMEAYGELLDDVASDVDEFTRRIDDEDAFGYLRDHGVDADSKGWSRAGRELLLPAARARVARSRQQLLATMVLIGIHRILDPDCGPGTGDACASPGEEE